MKKILIALIMAISVTTPIQTMAESVTQSEVEIKPSEQNIEQIIDEITSEPHPINSDAIQNVKEYIIRYFVPHRRKCFWHQRPKMQLLTALVKILL